MKIFILKKFKVKTFFRNYLKIFIIFSVDYLEIIYYNSKIKKIIFYYILCHLI